MKARKKRGKNGAAIPPLAPAEIAAARRGVLGGIRDIEEGRYEDFNAQGLLQLAKDIVADSMKKLNRRKTA